MNTNPTADGGPLIMYLVAESDREQADLALAIAHMAVADHNVAAGAAGHSGVRYGYDPDPGYTGWTYAMQTAGSSLPVSLSYRAGIRTVPTLNGTLAANTTLHVLCAEIVDSWQQEGLVVMHRDSLEWIAGNRDPEALMRAFDRFGTPKVATAHELLEFGTLLQRLLDERPAAEPAA